MKKVIKLLIIIFILIMLLELTLYIFKTSHNETYIIQNKNTSYKINEIYKNKKYYFKITAKNQTYSFETSDETHKRKKIIKKIYEYKKNNLYCIYPVIKNNKNTNILCSKNKNPESFTNNKENLTSFVKKLKKHGYNSPSWENQSNKSKKIETLIAYQNNINEDTHIYIYKYNGFFSVKKDSLEQINLFKNDTYINHLGTQIDKYYIIPNYDQKYDYNELYIIDMIKDKTKKRTLKQKISKDSYINGIIEDDIYIFDNDELKQYKINKKGKKVKEVGNKENGGLYYNLKFKTVNIYKFKDKNLKFKTIENHISKIENKTKIKYIKKNEDTYYYQTNDNNVYYYNLNNKERVLLFNKKITDFVLIKDNIYFINQDTLYSYNFTEGIKKLVTYSELSFNSENRLAIYME